MKHTIFINLIKLILVLSLFSCSSYLATRCTNGDGEICRKMGLNRISSGEAPYAKKWLLMGCASNDYESCLYLGDMAFYLGNEQEAVKWYNIACKEMGGACMLIGDLNKLNSQLFTAKLFYKDACDKDPSLRACKEIGEADKEANVKK